MTPLISLLVLTLGGQPAPEARRLAVLVGANAAPQGRQPLRYAHRDAQRLRDALVRAGGVDGSDAVLLLDPRPGEVLAALGRLSALARAEPRESVLYFYYSGHADESDLYPGGEPLRIEAVREALVQGGATVRVGIFDACRGGAWTRAKGLSAAPVVELRPAWALASEGTVLLASSSGLEEAHESDLLQGSFFTHHFIGGLLGAADASGDGAVTATEAFEYAQAHTVRDSARASLEPQHPSFELNLHGQKDLVLAKQQSGESTLAVEQAVGPLQVIELPLGLVLLELPEGKRSSRLSVAPGQYLIRRVGEAGVVTAREVRVAAGATTTIEESSLTLVGNSQLARKGDAPPPPLQETLLAARTIALVANLGVAYSPGVRFAADGTFQVEGYDVSPAVRLALSWAPFDWLELSFITPGVNFMLGARRKNELLLSAGLDFFGYSSIESFVFVPAGGVAGRHWFSPRTSLAAVARVQARLSALATGPVTIRSGLLFSHTEAERVSFNVGVSGQGSPGGNFALVFGSARLGFRPLPLVQVHLSDGWNLDFDAEVTLQVQPNVVAAQRYMAGVSLVW